jgi:tRNA modification GTPase
MQFQLDDTIGALATAPGGAGRGVIRVSGPAAAASVDDVFRPTDERRWKSARLASSHAGVLRLSALEVPVPVLLYRWPAGRSYTGQSIIEIHAPGAPPLLEAILADLFARGVRPAVAGEFTLRAFLSGRIDLVQAEAVLGVIDAADAGHLRTALRQLAGGISGRIVRLRDSLLDLLADLEAGLDFVDEDIHFVSSDEVAARIAQAEQEVGSLLAMCESRMQSTGRARIVLAGLPNAGKSTLFNALVGREAALVSGEAGTTRDYLHARVDWHGLTVELIDTAGWDVGDPDQTDVSHAAQALGQEQWGQADLIVWCSASDGTAAERELENDLLELLRQQVRPHLVVRTKADLLSGTFGDSLAVSGVNRQGLAELAAACVRTLAVPRSGSTDFIGTTAARCLESLTHARQTLSRARTAVAGQQGDELLAVELREAVDHLGRIVGAVYTDDILDRIFSRFCIGK